MEHFAKITHEHKLGNLWKYEFLDIQTSKEDWFYHHEKVSYEPNAIGKLNINKDKFLQSFEQEVNSIVEGIEETDNLVKYEERTNKIIEKIVQRFPKRQVEVSFQKLHELHKSYTWKEIANIYGKHEQTIYYWLKTNNKTLQKRGVKPIIDEKVISLVRSYALENKIKTQ